MKRTKDAGLEYAEIWGETVQGNRRLRTLSLLLAGTCLALGVFLPRIASAEPPRPIVVRADEVARAEAAEIEADPLDPTTRNFLNRFIDDFYSGHRATVEAHWTHSLGFLSTELANAGFARDGAENELQVEQAVLRIHAHPPPPHRATTDLGRVRLSREQETRRERWSPTLRSDFLEGIPSELMAFNPAGLLITCLQADRALATEGER